MKMEELAMPEALRISACILIVGLVLCAARPSHGDPLPSYPNLVGPALSPEALLGGEVSTTGDLNGDGYSDVALSRLGGTVFSITVVPEIQVYLGSASGLPSTPSWRIVCDPSFDCSSRFGRSVAVGDVNGDGIDDLI